MASCLFDGQAAGMSTILEDSLIGLTHIQHAKKGGTKESERTKNGEGPLGPSPLNEA